jgi:hypothetical protein
LKKMTFLCENVLVKKRNLSKNALQDWLCDLIRIVSMQVELGIIRKIRNTVAAA